jgi:hypothetical protein
MSFVLRVTQNPSLQDSLATSQIIVVDQTGKAVPLGPNPKAVCLVGEFLSGPFIPREISGSGDLDSTYGADVSNLLSQSAAGVQDGSGVRYEGNGRAELLGKQFTRLILQRVDCDMVADDTVSPPSKVFVKFQVSVNVTDQDPFDATITGRDIVIPAGRRFADAPIGTATYVIALSQKILIPKGTPIAAGVIQITFNLVQNADGDMRLPLAAEGLTANSGATAFFVKGTSNSGSALDTVIDSAIPGSLSTITATALDIVNAAAASSAGYAPGTTSQPLSTKIESLYNAAIARTRPSGPPQEDIGFTWAARRGTVATTIRNPLTQMAIDASTEGTGRIAGVDGPRIGSVTGDASSVPDALARTEGTGAYAGIGTVDETPGSGSESADRRIVCFPYVQQFSADLGKNIDVSAAGEMAVTLSNFANKLNPGARNPFIQTIQGFQAAFTLAPLTKRDYINLKAKGVAALRRDRTSGWQFQDGVTSVNPTVLQGRAPIKRRRMADEIEDGLVAIGSNYNKGPGTSEDFGAMTADIRTYLALKKKAGDIVDFGLDEKGGNTTDAMALGLFALIVAVKTVPSMDAIKYLCSIGETVDIAATTGA